MVTAMSLIIPAAFFQQISSYTFCFCSQLTQATSHLTFLFVLTAFFPLGLSHWFSLLLFLIYLFALVGIISHFRNRLSSVIIQQQALSLPFSAFSNPCHIVMQLSLMRPALLTLQQPTSTGLLVMEKSVNSTEIRISAKPIQEIFRKNVLCFRPYLCLLRLHVAFSDQKPTAEIQDFSVYEHQQVKLIEKLARK